MDMTPYFDPETKSVGFYANVRGNPIKAFVTREWLASHFGPDIPSDARLVDAYVAHAPTIDREIARRVDRGRLEPVWLACPNPPLE